MGNWVLTIEGTGCHHNNNEAIDADLLAPKLVKQLQEQGQHIEHATFTSGGRKDVMPPPGE
jgi:hypothetical protein